MKPLSRPPSSQFIPCAITALAALLLAIGCSPKPADTTQQVAPAASNSAPVAGQARTIFDQDVPTTPNPKLPTIRLFVGAQELKTELALDELQIRTGMMFRPGIAEDEATGSAAMGLCSLLGRQIDIRQGRGSRLLARPLGDRIEIGGRSVLEEVRDFSPGDWAG